MSNVGRCTYLTASMYGMIIPTCLQYKAQSHGSYGSPDNFLRRSELPPELDGIEPTRNQVPCCLKPGGMGRCQMKVVGFRFDWRFMAMFWNGAVMGI